MPFKDLVRVADRGIASLRNRAGAIIAGRDWGFEDEKPVVQVQGWVTTLMRERGKIVPGSHREGHNIWTNTGREFLALLMSIQTGPSTAFRRDSVAYLGVGTGFAVEDAGVFQLATPAAYSIGQFLAVLDVPPTFPLTPSRTTVRYHRTFAESEITLSPGSQVNISEMGLFTNGSPTASPAYNPGTRVTTLAAAADQAPVAYKSFEPIGKTDALEFEVAWEIRF